MAAPEHIPAVLVTGGAGYIGSHVCKTLRHAGYLPVTYDDLSGGHRWAVRWGPFEYGSLANAARLDSVMRRHNPIAVIHLAGLIAAGESVTDPASFYDVNVAGTLSLLGSMRRCDVSRIVFSSSAAVYGEPQSDLLTEDHPMLPISPYGASKMVSERMLKDYASAYGIRAMSLRYFNAVGADPESDIGEAHPHETHLVPIILDVAAGRRAGLAIYGTDYPTRDGTCVRDYIHVSDLAAAHALALPFLDQNEGAHALNLGNGAGTTVREVVEMAEMVTGRPIPVEEKPRRSGDPAVLVADASMARQLLGWQPAYGDLHTQMSTAWSWYDSVRAEFV